MKIVVITFAGYGAVAQYTAQLANALSKTCDVAVIIPSYADTRYFNEEVKLVTLPIPLKLMPAIWKTLNPFFLRFVVRTIKEMAPDVIHAVFEYRFPFPCAFLLHHRYPLVVTMHEPRTIPNRGRITNAFVALILYVNNRLLAGFSHKVIIHGMKLKSCRLISKLPSHEVKIVPLGDFSFFAQSGKAADAQEGNVLFFGRIVPYKGIEYLIQATKLARKEVPSINVTIAGAGDFTKYRRIIGKDSSFTVLNRFIPDDEVGELFQKASVVILPYTDGTQTGIISIAGAFKKPVIATDVGIFSAMVKDGKAGFIIPPKNANALAEAVIELLKDNKLRREMGENAYKAVKEKFSWDDIAQKTLEVYEEAIEAWERNSSKRNAG